MKNDRSNGASQGDLGEPTLLVVSGIETGRRLTLERDHFVTIGRDSECSFSVSDPAISRRHCDVVLSNSGITIRDAGSRWGTFVNGKRIESERRLREGDRVLVGETEFLVRAGGDATQTQMPCYAKAPQTRAPERNKARGEDRVCSDEDVLNLAGTTYLTYEVQSLIASARTGAIFRAHCSRQQRDVALKIFWPRLLSDDKEIARFVRAMQTAIPIRDPNIVSVFSAGRHRGVCYSASEIVEGESVAQLIDRIGVCGMLDWRRVLRIAIDIARGLVAASSHGIVHRNITPQNLLIRTQDDCAKLNDLVFAKAIEGTCVKQISSPGEVLGDLPFMSPEQLSTERPIDFRSDIYSLGAALYMMLTARAPIEGRSTRETMHRIEVEPPHPPTKYHLSISPLFEGEVMRMLEKRPEDRHNSPSVLLHDLERIGKYENVS